MSGKSFSIERLRTKQQEMLSRQNNESTMSLQNAIDSKFWSIPESVDHQEEFKSPPVNLEDVGSISLEEPLLSGFDTMSNRNSPIDNDENLDRLKKLDDDLDDFDKISVRTSNLTFTSSEHGFCEEEFEPLEEIDPPTEEETADDLFPFSTSTSACSISKFGVVLKPQPIDNQQIPLGQDPRPFYFTEIASPIHFWFHFSEYFLSFSEELNKKYSELGKRELNIEKDLIQPGMLIACYPKYFKSWHRAKVLTPLNEQGMCRVFLIDYGTVGLICLANMKLLLQEFAAVPKLSNRGRIPNLVPFNSITFPVNSVRKIFEKFSDVRMEGRVLRYDEAEDFYELELLYTNQQHRKQDVRDWLIRKQIAMQMRELGPHDILPLCYHLPTFDKLESDYPTFTELDYLEHHHGLDMETLVRTNFLENNVEEEMQNNPKLYATLGNPKLKDVKEFYFNT